MYEGTCTKYKIILYILNKYNITMMQDECLTSIASIFLTFYLFFPIFSLSAVDDGCVSIMARHQERSRTSRRLCLVDGNLTRGEEKLHDGCVSFLARHQEWSASIRRLCLVDVDSTRGEEKLDDGCVSVFARHEKGSGSSCYYCLITIDINIFCH